MSSTSIVLFSGRTFDLCHPECSSFSLMDIAHGLAHTCRFVGQTTTFYSVAQHSVIVSRIVPEMFALQALFHDGAEAFIGDVTTPLKSLLPDYRAIERRIERAVFGRLGLPMEVAPVIKRADRIAMNTERRDLMPAHADAWSSLDGVEMLQERITPVGPLDARGLFLSRLMELLEARGVMLSGFMESARDLDMVLSADTERDVATPRIGDRLRTGTD